MRHVVFGTFSAMHFLGKGVCVWNGREKNEKREKRVDTGSSSYVAFVCLASNR